MKSKINLITLSIILVTCSSFLIHKTFAQTETEIPVIADPGAAAVGTIGLVGAGTALLTSIYNDRKQKKNVKGTDVDFATALVIISKIFQVAYETDPNWKKTLDTKATSNVLVHTTLGQAFAAEADGWANFIQEQYNVARPSMSVPSVQKNADTTQKQPETKTEDPKPK
jgi:hypothetical protein